MSELSQLSPQPLWDIFAKICSIPHPSYHEEQLAEHIMGWAKEKGLHAERDQVGNILIRKGATAGMENRKPVALQAHLDITLDYRVLVCHYIYPQATGHEQADNPCQQVFLTRQPLQKSHFFSPPHKLLILSTKEFLTAACGRKIAVRKISFTSSTVR